jgi:hypothetical protein
MRIFLSLLMLLNCLWAMAGGGNETGGGAAVGMNGAVATQTNVWSTTNNIGALGLQDKYAVGVAFESRYMLPEAGLKTFAAAAPLGIGTVGLVGHQFGYSSYTDSRLGLGYGMKLSKQVSLGAQVNYLRVQMGDIYGSRSTLAAEIGLLIMPNDHVKIAAVAYNPTRAKLADFDDERVPSTLTLAGQYLFSEKVNGTVQVKKSLDLPINIITAIEYKPVDNLAIRTGYATAQGSLSFGLGYLWKELRIDAGAKWHQTIGFSSAASLSYEFGKRKKKA